MEDGSSLPQESFNNSIRNISNLSSDFIDNVPKSVFENYGIPATDFINLNEGNSQIEEESDVLHKKPKGDIIQTEAIDRDISVINTKALPHHVVTYEMEKFEKNALLIFNHRTFNSLESRIGTERDVEVLKITFENLGFKVKVEHDLKKHDIMSTLKTFTSQDFTDFGCVGVAVLSHGREDGGIYAKDMPYNEIMIVNHLQADNNPTLVTKPKLLIIQACRGVNKSSRGVKVGEPDSFKMDMDNQFESYILPAEADILILHSSYHGNRSHRDENKGTWFIQTLCSKINELSPKLDLEAIMTEVKKEVAVHKWLAVPNADTNGVDINKQMPVSTSTLIRKLYMRKFNKVPSAGGDVFMSKGCSHDLPTALPKDHSGCSCFLDYFAYIKDCLSHYLKNNPEDEFAMGFLNIANSLEANSKFHGAIEQTSKLIHQFLKSKEMRNNAYLYSYKF